MKIIIAKILTVFVLCSCGNRVEKNKHTTTTKAKTLKIETIQNDILNRDTIINFEENNDKKMKLLSTDINLEQYDNNRLRKVEILSLSNNLYINELDLDKYLPNVKMIFVIDSALEKVITKKTDVIFVTNKKNEKLFTKFYLNIDNVCSQMQLDAFSYELIDIKRLKFFIEYNEVPVYRDDLNPKKGIAAYVKCSQFKR